MNILVCTPAFGGKVCVNYMLNLYELMHRGSQEGYNIGIKTLSNNSLIPLARNELASHFLNDKVVHWDKLFFIDSDQSWTYEQAITLLKSNKDVVGGTYRAKCEAESLMFRSLPQYSTYFPSTHKTKAQLELLAANETSESNPEVPVAGLPTGFMLIDRAVLEKLTVHAPTYSYPDLVTGEIKTEWDFFRCGAQQNVYMPEDYFFSSACIKYGFTPFLHPKVVIKHEGTCLYG